ncbi:MAG: caspase family protein [Ramlibacter sp.]
MPRACRSAKTIRLGLTSLLLAAFGATAQAPGDLRVAVVIGNAAYVGGAELDNPVNDARAISETLRKLGFEVVELSNGNKAQMGSAIADASSKMKGRQGIGVLFYAGHGLQLDWNNYMVPVDAKLSRAADVEPQTLNVGSVVQQFKAAGNRMNIIILDACRDNPFAGYASSKGLAPMDAPPGTFLAYATAPGNVAIDGDKATGNGLYTRHLLAELQKPATSIEVIFKRVRLNVRKDSAGRQVPWESTSLEEEFVFNEAGRNGFTPEEFERLAREARQKEQALLQQAAQAHEKERQIALASLARLAREAEAARVADLEIAVNQARENERLKRLSAEQAREQAFARQQAEWIRVKDSPRAEDFFAFLNLYPSGLFSEHAQIQLDRLSKTHVSAQPDKSGFVATSGDAQRFRVGDSFTYAGKDLYGKEHRRRLRVTAVGADALEINRGAAVWDLQGNLIKDSAGERSPARITVPAELKLGKRWDTAYEITLPTGGKNQVTYSYRVVALEKIRVPAGEFDALRIEGVGWDLAGTQSNAALGPMPTRIEHVYWLDSRSLMLLKEFRQTRATSHKGGPPTGYAEELQSFARAPA